MNIARRILPLLICPWLSAAPRAFSIEDLYRLKDVAHLALSPDGSRVLFEVASQDLRKSTRATHVWMADLRSGAVRQLTFAGHSDTLPRWSADGKSFTFVSNREEGSQVWRMDMGGGEAKALTSFGPGIADPLVVGKTLFFQSTVFPEAMADEARNKAMADKLEKGPVQAHLADSLLYRHWTSYRDFQYTHLFSAPADGGPVTAITSGPRDFPGYDQSYDVAPDGRELCVATPNGAEPARSTNTDLFLIRLDGDRTPVCITGANPAADGAPRYSPDGRWIAYKFQQVPGFESDRFRLGVYDRTAKAFRNLTEALDNPVESFQWSADGKALWFTIQEKGRYPLYRVELSSGKPVRMLEGQSIREFVVAPDQGSVVFVRNRVGEASEVWSCRFPGKELRKLTAFNDAVAAEVDLRPAEELWVKGADGTPVQVFIVKPHGFDPAKKYPLILNVHGGPQMMWSDTFRGDWQVYPGAGYVVAFPNPHGSTGYGQAFTNAISRDWDGKVMTDIAKVTDALAALPYVDASRMGAMGWSWGGYAMMWLEGHTTRFKALAAMMGVYDLPAMHGSTEELWFPEWDLGGTPTSHKAAYDRMNPSGSAQAFKTPCLVITGEKDYRVPYTQSLEFFTDLQLAKVPSRLLVFKNDGHWPDRLKSMPVYYNAHLEWFAKYLGGAPAPWSTEALVRNQVFGD
ncbi:prolyl oligopeptidase [Mesoterricola silvestris]|uniref:Prolyl oligopeptidase n=1 Tax=Mesoterricola silvestris TaxID=2927979 RepID=A0AA48GVT1_9BACT|nr:prolyl oligopeptidase [Mesoterricola silvestris]